MSTWQSSANTKTELYLSCTDYAAKFSDISQVTVDQIQQSERLAVPFNILTLLVVNRKGKYGNYLQGFLAEVSWYQGLKTCVEPRLPQVHRKKGCSTGVYLNQ